MAQNIQGTFVSEKINKIRWRPDPFNNSHSFITGSWDNEVNSIKLWDFRENEDETDIYPFVVAEKEHSGDVTEAKFIDSDHFVCSSSYGSVNLYKIDTVYGEDIKIVKGTSWNDIHKFPTGENSPCTALATYDRDIASVGEDGRINLMTVKEERVIGSIENADTCSLKCVIFLKHNELLTSNLRGQMKVWDLKSSSDKPVNSFVLSGEMLTPTCLTYHPTQRHLVIAGDEEGSITIWDLRHNTFPINLLSGHEESLTEIQFHPDHPDHLFSSSISGEMWHWSTKAKAGSSFAVSNSGDLSVWFGSENIKNKLEVYRLMPKLHKPINSFDLNQTRLLCGCDNEAIYLVNDINMYN